MQGYFLEGNAVDIPYTMLSLLCKMVMKGISFSVLLGKEISCYFSENFILR